MSNKPVLYLLPGLLCDATVWEHQQSTLAPYAEIRIPVFKGISSFREMALSMLQDAPSHFSIVGHSMGGRVALELMHLFPDRIDKFALMSVGVHPLQPGEFDKRMAMVDLAEQKGMEALADAWIPPMVHPSRHQDTVLMQSIRAMVLRNTPADHRCQIEAALTRADQSLYLPTIRHQVLLLCGEDDGWSPLSQHKAIQQQLPKSELHSIAAAGHMVTMEQPDSVSQVLLQWFTAS
ncbi:MAG: alpha/beta hydrolase [Pseudomonadales bacterium]|nr:alpha/beta hydrolase [Pseudomonadales bacterium]